MKKYFALEQQEDVVNLYIYGDISSYSWYDEDTSIETISRKLNNLSGIKTINVYINSYGGEVAEGLAIYNYLRRHEATINTYVDGFACSAASIIFMAGDNRIMPKSSLLMIHNAWTYTAGNAEELRKDAEDLEKINTAVRESYLEHISIDETELTQLLNDETWLTSEEALEKGFATKEVEDPEVNSISASVREKVYNKIISSKEAKVQEEEKDIANKVANKVIDAIKSELSSKEVETSKEVEEDKFQNLLKTMFKGGQE